jgi:hypothetical protein
LDTYVSGDYTIPAASIKYYSKEAEQWQEVKTEEIKIRIKSLLQRDPDASDIRDIIGPKNFSSKIGLYIALILGTLAITTGIVAFIFMRRKKKKEEVSFRPEAHEIAYEALSALNKKGYLHSGLIKQYYIELSDIVRRYLENRFAIRAPEMTTEEFLHTVKNNKTLSYEHTNILKDFLSHCDLVKFAKYHPLEDELSKSFELAKRLVDETKEKSIEKEAGQAQGTR